jgi:hypothetical protein
MPEGERSDTERLTKRTEIAAGDLTSHDFTIQFIPAESHDIGHRF